MINEYVNKVKKSFEYLETKFGFKLVSTHKDYFGESVLYRNNTTAVEIRYEKREKKLFILLMRLINNQILEYPIFIKPQTEINSFYLDDIIDLKLKKSFKKSEMDLEKSMKFYSSALEKYGSKVLKGDFEIFSDIDKIVKKRVAELKGK